MQSQTIDNLMPLLNTLQQPAFCLGDDGVLTANRAARHLVPWSAASLPAWLGSAAERYEGWDRTGILEIPLDLRGSAYSAAIHPLQDGTLFLLTACSISTELESALATASQVLRLPLADLSVLVRHMEEEHTDSQRTAAINRHLYRLTRIAANLSDLERFRQGTFRLRLEQLDVNGFLQPLLEEADYLFRQTGKTLHWKLPAKTGILQADPVLLERALLNLMSNALKFSPDGAEIHLRIAITPTQLQLRLENPCANDGDELLRSAFSRLEQRDLLPDPRWGIGLGLPLTQTIARLHGGLVTIDIADSTAAVTLCVQRRQPASGKGLEAPPAFEYNGGIRRSLLELSDALPSRLYHKDAL